jgi:tetratricopeptide (TPR) repeat protein
MFDTAAASLDRTKKSEKEKAEYWFLKGEEFGDRGKHREAILCYDKAVKADKKHSDALNYRGVAYYRLKDYVSSLVSFDAAIGADPNNKSAHKNRGNVLSLMKRYEEAITSYDKALSIDPVYAAALVNKGNALYGLERYDEAICCYDKALEHSSGSGKSELIATAYNNRGQSKYNLGNLVEALEDFQRVNMNDLNGRKFNNIGLCYYQLGLYKEAEMEFTKAIKADPRMVYPYYNLAVLFNAEGELNKSKRFLNICLKINRNFSKARDALKKLSSSSNPDWYEWWFSGGLKKKALGLILLVFTVSLILATAFISLVGPDFHISYFKTPALATNVTVLLVALIGFLLVILLLPSLRKVKLGEVELETIPFSPKLYELELSLPMTGRGGR